MNNNEELLRKWQLKKIATLAFINDECDDMKLKDRKAFYSMMEAIFGEIVSDLKNLTLAAVSKSEDVEREDSVCACGRKLTTFRGKNICSGTLVDCKEKQTEC